MKRKPLISVVIIGFNTRVSLKELLMSIENQSYGPLEIIYIDDGSSDGSYEEYSLFKSRFIKRGEELKKNKGRVFATQRGINMASGEWLFFIRSNEILEKTTLSQYLTLMERHSSVAYAGSVRYECKDRAFASYLNNASRGVKKYQPGAIIKYKYLLFNNSLIHSSVFEFIQLNQELSKYGGEELDFSYKLNRLFPKKISACPGAVVLRKNYPSLKEHCCRLYEFGNHNLKKLGPHLQGAVIKQPCLLFVNLNFLIKALYLFCFAIYKINIKFLNYYIIRVIMLCSILRGFYKGS